MGYVILSAQLKTINKLVNDKNLESCELLWLPGRIKLTVWIRGQTSRIYEIDEDGRITSG